MRPFLIAVLLGIFSATQVGAQTFTDCNPLERSCPSDPALGRAAFYDFTAGPSNDFKDIGKISYGANGAEFTISHRGQSPLIQSNWYIMFGRVEMISKAAPGTGIVSCGVLQSDDLDEIDWEWLGINNNQVQSNYFGKGNTHTYSRGAFHSDPANHDEFHTYTIDWSSDQLVWQIDGKTVRVVTPEAAEGQYPQTPMMVKIGIWAGGDPGNAPGTIQWAGGETDFNAGPYTMYVKSLHVVDYSTGSSYSYGDKSGSWQSIISDGGQINGNSGGELQPLASTPTVTATISDAPIPWDGTHRETTTAELPSIWPWIPTTFPTSEPTMTPLPSGLAVSGSVQVQPLNAVSQPIEQPASSASLGVSLFSSGTTSRATTMTSTELEPTVSSATAGDDSAVQTALSSNIVYAAPR